MPGVDALAASAEIVVAETDSGDVDAARAAAAFAECAWRVLAPLAADPSTELYVSIAGGRKPAAAILGVLMSVLGRPQDRLSHVLIEPEAAAHAGVFYPARMPRPMLSAGQLIDAHAVSVMLIDIPFPRLHRLPAASEALSAFFARLENEGRNPRLVVDLQAGKLLWDGTPMVLPPALATFFAWLAIAARQGRVGIPRVGAARGEYLSLYRRFAEPGAARRHEHTRLPDPLDAEWVEEKAARLARWAEQTGLRPRGLRLLQRVGPRAKAFYRLALGPEEIEVKEAAE